MTEASLLAVQTISEPRTAAALLDPLRTRILALAREPASATEIARQLEMPRQRVHYHVRELERFGLLLTAGRRRRRNLIEQRFVATARSYVLAPGLLGPLAPDWRTVGDTASGEYLLALLEQVRDDVGRATAKEEAAPGEAETAERPATVSLKAQFRLESAAQRTAFATALREALVAAIARHTSPDRLDDGRPGKGGPHRLLLACYPVPAAGREERPRGGRT